jgi:OFA family oxalate/formate antiporter-like MFS transporter
VEAASPCQAPDTRPPPRWQVAAAGVAMQVVLGTVYAWSVFKKPLMATHGWSNTQATLAFTLAIIGISLGAAFGGKFVDRAGSRSVALLAAVLFSLGTALAGVADHLGSLWLLWAGYGVIGGVGNGLGYITPIAVLVRWFPDKRGLITGLAVMGFGLGAAVMGQIAPVLIPRLGVALTFYLASAVYLVVMLASAAKLNNPPDDWGTSAAAARRAPDEQDCDLRRALGMFQFYLLWALLFINVTAGLALISNLSPMAQQQLGVTAVVAGTIVLLGSLANGLGRISWAALSDVLGRKTTFVVIFATQIPLFLLLPQITHFALMAVVCCYILGCYGAGFAVMPAFAADTFGTRCMGQVYGKILLAWGAGGALGPMLMEWASSRSGSFVQALHLAAVFLGLGLVLTLFYRKSATQASGA